MTTAASRKTYLDATMINRCQDDDTFVAFQLMGIFRFWRNGKFTFFQRCLQPLYFSQSPPPTQLNLPFCAGVQFSRDYICALNDRIKIRENRGLWTVYTDLSAKNRHCPAMQYIATISILTWHLNFRPIIVNRSRANFTFGNDKEEELTWARKIFINEYWSGRTAKYLCLRN